MEYARADLARLLLHATRALEAEMSRRLAAAGFGELRPRHLTILRALEPGEEGMALSALARDAGVTRQAAQQVADELERMGIAESLSDPRDRRVRLVRYTARGREGYAKNLEIFTQLEGEYAERVGADTLAAAKELLRAIVTAPSSPD